MPRFGFVCFLTFVVEKVQCFGCFIFLNKRAGENAGEFVFGI